MADFAKIKASIPIERAAKLLNLELHQERNQLRGPCPACNQGDDRMLAITPSKGVGVFYCRVADTGGSCIDLVAHITGMSLKDAADWLEDTLPHSREATVPTEPGKKTSTPVSKAAPPTVKKSEGFDPQKFADKLTFDESVAALGITEELAKQYKIGTTRNKLYLPLCPADVQPVAWVELADGTFRLPAKWLTPSNVVPLKKRA